MPGPLSGIRVIDLSAVVSGPLATTILADQGADVIKIEPLGVGDILRHVGSRRGGVSGMFHVANRGKRSLALNLADARGRELLERLAHEADVFVQNFRPGVVERMGIGPETLCARNPRLVYVSISGFGPTGPCAQQRVYDNVIQAVSGFAAVQTEAGEPRAIRQLVCDKLTSLTAAQAITAALFARERGAGGQRIELAMLDAAIAFLWVDAASDHTLLGDGVERHPTIGSNYNLLRTADGFAAATVLSDAEFRGLCLALDLPEVAADPRFASVADRMAHLSALAALFSGEIAGAAGALTRAQLEERMAAHDVPCGGVVSLDELPAHPQVRENAILQERVHPLAGPLREPRPAARFHATPAAAGRAAPRLGEHSAEVLAELGLSPDEIDRLCRAQVVGR